MIINKLVVCTLTALLVGCVSVPAYESGTSALMNSELRAKLKIGETTQSQVREWYGVPAIVARDQSAEGIFEVWSYSFVQSGPISVTPFGSEVSPSKMRSLGLRFSADGVLRGISDLESPLGGSVQPVKQSGPSSPASP
jgi:hypothetical protein